MISVKDEQYDEKFVKNTQQRQIEANERKKDKNRELDDQNRMKSVENRRM
ncbi:hypothetical protein SAMN05443094_10569 [Domibacillus enclensis]|uniref:Uncharacterized protein n=1 Tax=Domibacillus enclensis TaxID=1017273 RepID=A0A1N6XVQ0_9BACI|nr:hypothetical protein SAMN05443094_10569 [Domibacillus enclensis]